MNESKPREWWIYPGVEAWQSDEVVMNPSCVKEYHIHVIEKSSYDAAIAERDYLRADRDVSNEKCVQAILKLSAAIKERDELRSKVDYWEKHHMECHDKWKDEKRALMVAYRKERDAALALLREAREALNITVHHLENLHVPHPHDCDLDAVLTRIDESGVLK